MKTKWLLLTGLGLILNCCQSFGSSLDNWHWRNPLPDGNPQSDPHTLRSVIFANGVFVGAGDSGIISVSTDTTNWTESPSATTVTLRSLIYANGLFVAAGDNGVVETSTNGSNWVEADSGTTGSLTTVTFGNGQYVAAGSSVVLTSSDAIHWSASVSGLAGATGLAGGNSGFVAIDGSDKVFFSSDGKSWGSQILGTLPGSSDGNPIKNHVTIFANGQYVIASTSVRTTQTSWDYCFTSTDGIHWNTNAIGVLDGDGTYYNFLMSGNDNVIAGISPSAFRSTALQFSSDGVNWITRAGAPNAFVQGIAGTYGNGTYLIVAEAAYGIFDLPPIFTSTDGLNWTNQQHSPLPPVGPTSDLTSITFKDGVYAAVASNATVRSSGGLVYESITNSPALSALTTFSNSFVGVGSGGKIFVSGDGISWTQRNSGTANSLNGVASGNELVVTVGDNGSIQTSPTGTIWTSRISGTSLSLYSVAYSGSNFVAVGQMGTVLTSPDGISWSVQDSGQLTNLVSVTYGSGGFVTVGPKGTVLTSIDGVTWTKQSCGTSANLNSIAYGNGYYLVAGDNATVLASPDAVNWTPLNVGATGQQSLYGTAFLNGRFDIVGSGGTILESDTIDPLFSLEIHHDGNWLTVFVPPGSDFRIQTSTNLNSEDWIDVASFNNASPITQWTNTSAGLNQGFYRAISP